ncbi:MAG: formylglycine-generating enzyme family protein [Hyphomicrobium sp.]
MPDVSRAGSGSVCLSVCNIAVFALMIGARLAGAGEASSCMATQTVIANEPRCVKPQDTFKDCADCPEMVVVPAGRIQIGSPQEEAERAASEGPRRDVVIGRPIAAGKTEVTFAEWDACVADGGCKHVPRDPGWGRGRRPVVNVSWNDATREFLPWLSKKTGQAYRLLTESEWEYAARGGTQSAFHTGATITTGQANFDGTSTYGGSAKGVYRQKTLEVASLAGNAFGLFDMHGNVWEWVQDCYGDTHDGTPADGSARAETPDCPRVLRGGSWIDSPRVLRSANRGRMPPAARFIYRGFRVARGL